MSNERQLRPMVKNHESGVVLARRRYFVTCICFLSFLSYGTIDNQILWTLFFHLYFRFSISRCFAAIFCHGDSLRLLSTFDLFWLWREKHDRMQINVDCSLHHMKQRNPARLAMSGCDAFELDYSARRLHDICMARAVKTIPARSHLPLCDVAIWNTCPPKGFNITSQWSQDLRPTFLFGELPDNLNEMEEILTKPARGGCGGVGGDIFSVIFPSREPAFVATDYAHVGDFSLGAFVEVPWPFSFNNDCTY